MRGIIAAVSPDGVIGVGNDLPWRYPADMARFKRLTEGTTVIMGRRTWESLPRRPLANRRNVVITSRPLPGVECFPSIEDALATCTGDVWFIGGRRIFEDALVYADRVDLTLVPDRIPTEGAVLFPPLDEAVWEVESEEVHEADPRLQVRILRRRRYAGA